VVVWHNDSASSSDEEIAAQRLDSSGTVLWGSSDVKVNQISDGSDQLRPAVGVDSDGNAIVVWQDERVAFDEDDIYAQKLNTNGVAQWGSSDKIVNEETFDVIRAYPHVDVDPSGYAVAAWWDERHGAANCSIYAQRLNPDGERQWDSSDVRVNQDTGSYDREYVAVAIDNDNCAIITWDDERGGENDVYAQKLFCEDAGRTYIFYGKASWSSSYSASVADDIIDGERNGDKFGISVSRAGDVDNSNYNDIIVGAMGYNYHKGRAYVFYGDGSIPASAGSADRTYTGETFGDGFGFSVSNAGDVDNDGKDDVIVGAPYNDDGGTDAGEAYVNFGGDQYFYVDSNTRTYGYTSDFNNAKSASDGGAYATLSEGYKLTYGGKGSEVTIDSALFDAMDEYNPSPAGVFTSDQVGYVFYIDTSEDAPRYSKTTDGGTTWPTEVDLGDDINWANIAVWYDRWTPGDTTGTKIHIVANEVDTDDVWYTYLDTSGDTLRSGGWIAADTGTNFDPPDGGPSITKSTDGYLFIVWFDSTPRGRVMRSTDGGDNWASVTPGTLMTDDDDHGQLLPLSGGDILLILWDASAYDLISNVWDEGTDTWDGWVTIDGSIVEASTYDAIFGATLYKSTGDIYLAYDNSVAISPMDLLAKKYTESTRTWSSLTDIAADVDEAIDCKMAIDENAGKLYAIYTKGKRPLAYRYTPEIYCE